MSGQSQIESLRSQHQKLETEIASELQRPLPDEIKVTDLKRRKLRIKDEIAKLESTLN